MIPVKLTFQGIYSYQKEQIIDFTRLTDAGLFGIFGHVGSGKSTILEAISFALFNKIDRLSGERRNYNMMNLKSDKLHIDFEFLANDGIMYRSEVSGKRNKKNFSDVPTFKRSFYRQSGKDWIPADERTAEKVTGLSYDNFHRTIIIPQGRFQEFLQLGTKERVTMLKELFGLQKYDLSDKTSALERENNERLQNLEGRFAQIGEIKAEDILVLREQVNEAQKALIGLGKEQQIFNARNLELENLKKITWELLRQQEKSSSLQSAEMKYKIIEDEMREYEKLHLAFHSDFEQLKNLQEDLDRQTKELLEKTIENEQLSDTFSSMKKDYDELKPLFEKRDDLLKQNEELGKLMQARGLEENIEKLKREVQLDKKNLTDLETEILTGKGSLKDLSGQLTLKKKELPDVKMLSEIKNWFRENKSLLDQISGQQARVLEINKLLNEKLGNAFSLAGSIVTVEGSPETFDFSACFGHIEEAHGQAEANLRNLAPELSELELQKRLGTIAGDLHEGKPCPLCGSRDHPDIVDVKDVSEKLDASNKRKSDLEKEIRKFTRGETDLSVLIREISLLRHQIKSQDDVLDSLHERQKDHRCKFIWEKYNSEEEQTVIEELNRFDEVAKEISALELKTEEIEKSFAAWETRRGELAAGILKTDKRLTECSTETALLRNQLIIIKPEEWDSRPMNDLEEKSASLKREHKSITEKYIKLEEQLKTQGSQIDKLKGTIENVAKQVESYTKQTEQVSQRIAKKLIQYGGIDREHVEVVISKDINLEKTKKDIAEFRAEFESVKNLMSDLEKEIGGREYPEQEHLVVKEQLQQLQVKTDEKNQHMGKIKTDLANLEQNIETLRTLKKENDTLRLRADNLATLRNLFRGAAFVNFASRAYLENIVMAANARFQKLTRRHLELVLDQDNNFMIRDHMNEGKQRSVKTLSGGQTFQASLTLALALADNVNHQVEADQNFFFLDEGFGSLDKESLGIVFDTLKSLRKENRIVGVISHVEEMQQEIDANLVVTMDEEQGSTIKCSLD